MAVTAVAPGKLTLSLWSALRASHPTKCMLTDSSWALNKDTTQYIADVTGEITGTGYTAGGATLANVSESYDSGNNRTIVDAADPTWDAAGGTLTAAGCVFYLDTGTASSSPVIASWDFGGAITATNAAFIVKLDATGMLILSD